LILDPATALCAGALVRRHLVATVVLGLFAGIAGGLAIGAWGAARRTDSSFDRFVAYERAATYHLRACPPDADPAAPDFLERCRRHDQADIAEYLRTVPGVESAGRWSFAISGVAKAETPDDWVTMLVPFALDAGALSSMGRPIVVDGRLADQNAANEIVVNEEMAALGRLAVGDEIVVTIGSADEFDAVGEGRYRPTGLTTTMEVVGVIRRPGDLTVRSSPGDESIVDSLARAEGTFAWAQRFGLDFAGYGIGVVVDSDTLSGDDVLAALDRRWPGRPIMLEQGPPNVTGDPSSALHAIELQAVGLRLLAAVAGAAALVFAGQAIARQSRREWVDADTLGALGMTRPTMVRVALVRSLATAVIAAVAAGATAIAVSPLGPAGIARSAEPTPGIAIDTFALAIGLPLTALAVLAFATAPVAARRQQALDANPATLTGVLSSTASPTFSAGWAMTRTRRAGGLALGSAVAGVTLAAATGIAAWQVTASFEGLIDTPARYGAEWDALVGNVATQDQAHETEQRLAAIPGIRAVRVWSTPEQPGSGFTLVAGVPVVGEVNFGTVVAGRPPTTSEEVALGVTTMRELGLSIGDEVTLPLGGGDLARPFEVVGEAIVNDGFEARPGRGGLVTPEAFTAIAPDGSGSTYAVWVDEEDGVDRDRTLAAVRAAFPTTFVEPRPTDKISNLRQVAGQPKLLTAVVGLLAGAALVHAVAMSVVRSRRQIGVLKTLGFTRSQVMSSVGWHATTIAGSALLVGVPLGIVGGRLAWTAIVSAIGLRPHHLLPVAAVFTVAAIVLVVANVAALIPGLAAARTRPATALRAE
jgi:hypothetical protein